MWTYGNDRKLGLLTWKKKGEMDLILGIYTNLENVYLRVLENAGKADVPVGINT